jgi:proton-dependent oligopeptide transporter, POT family
MTTSTAEPTWFGQPRGLTILFLTNMWEQFSYFGMRALLVYYMTKALMFSQGRASFIYGAYTACAYLTPIVGGVIADRVLGKRHAVIIGALIMAAGHFMMAFEPLFFPALATIALGNGLFLPSLPSQINDLYAPGDDRRGWAYNVYYVGINIGGFLAPLVCGTLGEVYGWHYGFAAAGVGMVAGLIIYLSGQRYLPVTAAASAPHVSEAATSSGTGRATIRVLLGVALAVIVFRCAYEQVGNTLALWADSGVNRQAGAHLIPMTWFQSLNPLLVMLMTPPLLALWRRRAGNGRDTSPARRMAAGAAIVAAAWALLALVSLVGGTRAEWPWLVLFFVIFTFGELHILPAGLGLFARLAPQRLGATTIAAWYLTIFGGSLAAGLTGTLWSAMSPTAFFLLLTSIGLLAAMLLRGLDGPVRRIDPTELSHSQ